MIENEQLDIEQELIVPQLIRGPSAEIQHIPQVQEQQPPDL